MTIQFIVGSVITVAIMVIAYMVSGLIKWGRTEERLDQNRESISNINKKITEIEQKMITPSDLKLEMLQMQNEIIRSFRREFVTRQEDKNNASQVG